MDKRPVYKKLVNAGVITGIVGILLVAAATFAFCPIVSTEDQINPITVKERLIVLDEQIKHLEFDLSAFRRLATENIYDLKGDPMYKQAEEEIESAKTNRGKGEEEFKKALSLLEGGEIEDAKMAFGTADGYVEAGFRDVAEANTCFNNSLRKFANEKFPDATEEDLKRFIAKAEEAIEAAEEYIDSIKYVESLPFLSLKEVEKELDYSRNTLEESKSRNPDYSLGCAYALLAKKQAAMTKEEARKEAGAFRNFCVFLVVVPIALLIVRSEFKSLRIWGKHGKLISGILEVFEKKLGRIIKMK